MIEAFSRKVAGSIVILNGTKSKITLFSDVLAFTVLE